MRSLRTTAGGTQNAIATTARPRGHGWVLDGTKSFVLDGAVAGLLLVAARASQGVSLFAVDTTRDRPETTALPTLDLTRKMARIELCGTPARLVGLSIPLLGGHLI